MVLDTILEMQAESDRWTATENSRVGEGLNACSLQNRRVSEGRNDCSLLQYVYHVHTKPIAKLHSDGECAVKWTCLHARANFTPILGFH